MGEGLTIGEAIESAAKHFNEKGIDEGRRDAQLLMQHLLKVDLAGLLSRSEEILPTDLQTRYSALVRRRSIHEPVQYITRQAEFWSLDFYIDPRAPVPRPETEHIIEEVIRDHTDRSEPLKLVDVGTGSGVLAIVLALEYPSAVVIGTDLEAGSLEVASINASRHNVSNRVQFVRGDIFPRDADVLGPESVNIMVSNPPYVSEGEISKLAPEVSKAEPRRALVAGKTGLEVFQRLIPLAESLLVPGGRLYMECGAGQAGKVKVLIEKSGMEHVRAVPDLQKIPRVVVGEKRGAK